jgi:hypothetical protein
MPNCLKGREEIMNASRPVLSTWSKGSRWTCQLLSEQQPCNNVCAWQQQGLSSGLTGFGGRLARASLKAAETRCSGVMSGEKPCEQWEREKGARVSVVSEKTYPCERVGRGRITSGIFMGRSTSLARRVGSSLLTALRAGPSWLSPGGFSWHPDRSIGSRRGGG